MKRKSVLVKTVVFTALMLTLTSQTVRATDIATGSYSLHWQHQRLDLSANDAPFAQVMQAIAEETGLEINGLEALKGSIKTHFSGLTLPAALQTLLQRTNYLLRAPAASSGSHYAISILSRDPAGEMQTSTSSSAKAINSEPIPASAGYVAEPYKKLYAYAARGDWQALTEVFNAGDTTAQAITLQLLARKKPNLAAELAAQGAKSTEPSRRLSAVQTLSELDTIAATNVLGTALHDSDIAVRKTALTGLHAQSASRAIIYLTEALQDEDASIRLLALDLLADKGTDGLVGIKVALNTSDSQLSERARELLQQMAPEE